MPRWIDAEKRPCRTCPHVKCYAGCEAHDKWLRGEATADVVEVVRCKGCQHYDPINGGWGICKHNSGRLMAKNDFCSVGKRKER